MLSAPRFATYLQASNDDRRAALELYHWNLQVSAAFMVPLHVVEVTLRNAIADAITAVHGGAWPWTSGFLISLPNPSAPAYSPRRDLEHCARRQATAGKVIAELKFVFWEKMLAKHHHQRLWQSQFFAVFPDAPRGVGADARRAELRDDVEAIRRLRNRIAHHEPIFTRDLATDMARVMRCVEWRDLTTRRWVDSIETVSSLLALRP